MDLDPTRPDNIEPGPLTGSTDVDKLIIWPNPDTDYYLLSFIFFHFFFNNTYYLCIICLKALSFQCMLLYWG